MESLLPVINKLQDVFHSVGMLDTIDLPQIAVVGSQSSGKSSVLEHVVGRDFLPRGSGIVTRRPLVLQLINVPKPIDKNEPEEWGEFLHVKKKFVDFEEIRKEIVSETDKVTGKNKGVSPLPINLKIFSPNVLNLTLIDLPGLTKIAVGDQPKDIEVQIRKMILQFIQKPNCIILAVTPANTDLANSDALKLAREVDQKGERTIGVLTKVDIMDKGTDCMDVLSGKLYPLKRGYIGVALRSQYDIDNGKKIENAIKDEIKFFENHSVYGKVASKMGTQYLAKTMNQILLQHIRLCLPEIKNKIAALIQQAQKRLLTYGEGINDNNMSEGATLLSLLNKYSSNYIDLIDGNAFQEEGNNNKNELFGGSRINHIFTQKYTPYLIKLDNCDNLTDEDIKVAIRNSKGPKSSLFIPEAAFEMLVKSQVKLLLSPSIQCCDQVYEELVTILDFAEKDLIRFPNLKEAVREFVINLLKEYLKPLKKFITDLIDIELSYINTNHPDFYNGGNTSQLFIQKFKVEEKNENLNNSNKNISNNTVNNQKQQVVKVEEKKNFSNTEIYQKSQTDKEQVECDIIKQLLVQYFIIVRKNISDSVPKAIMCFLVNKSKTSLQSELVRKMYKEELFKDLLKENDDIAQKRKATQKMLSVLQKAQTIINEIKDISI